MSSNTHSVVYQSSSSSTRVLGADGQWHSAESASEQRAVDDVLAGRSMYRDSAGNLRAADVRGVGDQLRERVLDRPADGQARTVENLIGVDQSSAPEFDSRWQQAAAKVDQEGRFLGIDQQQQLGLGAGDQSQQRQIQ